MSVKVLLARLLIAVAKLRSYPRQDLCRLNIDGQHWIPLNLHVPLLSPCCDKLNLASFLRYAQECRNSLIARTSGSVFDVLCRPASVGVVHNKHIRHTAHIVAVDARIGASVSPSLSFVVIGIVGFSQASRPLVTHHWKCEQPPSVHTTFVVAFKIRSLACSGRWL